jgi:1-acyl-sn-glycerol-3-phosphate acyltransferase
MIHFMATEELFRIKVLGPMVKWYSAFPVTRGVPDRSAIKRAVALLKEGEVVCMYPEGGITGNKFLSPLMPGAGLVVRLAHAQVICCGLRNTDKVIPFEQKMPRPGFCVVHANWGESRIFGKEHSSEEILEWATIQLKSLMEP